MSLPSSTRWRLADPGLVIRHWTGEDERVIYSPRSGDVHLINSAASALLSALARQPLTEEHLIAHMAAANGRPADSELAGAVRTSLLNLDEVGLIDPLVP